jgi:malto-oligosyltrehalose synthase
MFRAWALVSAVGDSIGAASTSAARHPASTYRLQLRPGFGFRAAAAQAGYLASLGITHAYLSPILQAAPGSAHGYDVVDHSRISAELGGEDEFLAMAAEFARRDVGLVVDVVPNHMGIPAPEFLNRQLWPVLREGHSAATAHWFDIDWAAHDGRMLLPILPAQPGVCHDDLLVTRLSALADPRAAAVVAEHGDEPVLRFHEHVLPLRPGTAGLRLPDLLDAQHYELACWRTASTALNWRRFFDISSLIAIKVNEPDVFAAVHAIVLSLVADGIVDGLRIDHPDGLADPRGYLRQLAQATGGSWVVAEKILAAGEELPADWPCAGTTGYDALAVVDALFTDPAGIEPLGRLHTQLTHGSATFAGVAWTARHDVTASLLQAEVRRLARLLRGTCDRVLRAADEHEARTVVSELLAAFEVYRTYSLPGVPVSEWAARQIADSAARASGRVPDALVPVLSATAAALQGAEHAAGCDQCAEFVTLFQQICAAVQAKGVEDTAMYRWSRLASANEVGADPDRPSLRRCDFDAFCLRLVRSWPATMTTLSTHDSKRQEDARSRIATLAESPATWAREVAAWHRAARRLSAGTSPEPRTEYLLWQSLVGAWPIDADRLGGFLVKAMREAKTATSWLDPDRRYESAVLELGRAILADCDLTERIGAFVGWLTPDADARSLGCKLVQLTMPGIPDVYQGCELAGYSLVDPDNRRPADFDRRREMLAALPETAATAARTLDAAKLLVTSRTLRLRRDHPDWFAGSYEPLPAGGTARDHVVAFSRSDRAVTVATRLPAGLRRRGGWQDTTLRLAPGSWRDVLTGSTYSGGDAALSALLGAMPVALLARDGEAG